MSALRKEWNFPVLDVEGRRFRQVFRCLLHTVLFHRALGQVTPEDEYDDFLDLTYVRANEREVTELVHKKTEEIKETITSREGKDSVPTQPKSISIEIEFYTQTESTRLFGSKYVRSSSPWETWTFPMNILPQNFEQAEQRKRKLKTDLQTLMLKIVADVTENLHIPQRLERLNDAIMPYPVEVKLKSDQTEGGAAAALGGLFQSIFKNVG